MDMMLVKKVSMGKPSHAICSATTPVHDRLHNHFG
ncbi:Dymeclin [Psidium guajava]|nr:Dymeclin [Psidium guajava]